MRRFSLVRISLLSLSLIVLHQSNLFGQAVSINASGAAPDPSSILDVAATDKGVLLPRMSTLDMTSIGSPVNGLTVFNTSDQAYYYFSSSAPVDPTYGQWLRMVSGSGFTLDVAYDGGGAGLGRSIQADANPVVIRNGATFSNSNSSVSLVTDGYVGLGIETPTYPLHVFRQNFGSLGGDVVLARFEIDKTNGTGHRGGIEVVGDLQSTTEAHSYIDFKDNSAARASIRIGAERTGGGQLVVSSNDGGGLTEIMVLDNGGNLQLDGLAGGGVRYLTTDNGGNIQATSTIPGDNLGNHTATQNLEMATFAIVASDGVVNVGNNLTISGRVNSNGIQESSDIRFKKNISKVTRALEKVLDLEGVTYNWRVDEFPSRSFGERVEYGLVAQAVEKVVPELVDTDKDGYKSVQYSHMVPLLIEAIKEQNELLSKQDSKIAELKASVESLSDFISTSKK